MKLNLKVGDAVETSPMTPFAHGGGTLAYPIRAVVREIDSHPFEYDIVRLELQDLPYIPPSNAAPIWVSERYLRRTP